MCHARVLVGVFVGGASRRMGRPKGLLPAPDGTPTLVERLAAVARQAAPSSSVVLVGAADAYAALGFEALPDAPANIGPLGGLVALCERALETRCDAALALACDLPFVDETMLRKLLGHAPGAAAVAPRVEGTWQPLCARYAPEETLAAARATLDAGQHALWRVLARFGERAVPLQLAPAEAQRLADWDSPQDI